jgi:hypothetical protein
MQSMEKNQNNKTSCGVEAFPENMFFFHAFQKSMFYNPLVLLIMITLKQSYDQFKFKW